MPKTLAVCGTAMYLAGIHFGSGEAQIIGCLTLLVATIGAIVVYVEKTF